MNAILAAKNERDNDHNKFLAALQGVDLDKESETVNVWEDKLAKARTGKEASDITSLQGESARLAGFGIGMGLEFEEITA